MDTKPSQEDEIGVRTVRFKSIQETKVGPPPRPPKKVVCSERTVGEKGQTHRNVSQICVESDGIDRDTQEGDGLYPTTEKAEGRASIETQCRWEFDFGCRVLCGSWLYSGSISSDGRGQVNAWHTAGFRACG